MTYNQRQLLQERYQLLSNYIQLGRALTVSSETVVVKESTGNVFEIWFYDAIDSRCVLR